MRARWLPLTMLVAAACSDTNGVDVLRPPAALSSVSLDGAITLFWSDDSYQNSPNSFEHYRIYSTLYDLDTDTCGANWRLEGTTVAPEFLVSALANGVPRCFTVTAINEGDVESDRSPIRADTPRPDARNVVLFARQVQNTGSGFRFWDDMDGDGVADNAELGLVRAGSLGTNDFSVELSGGRLWFRPVRSGTGVELYSDSPVDDLTSIDFAPDLTYRTSDIEALPGYGYVFAMNGGDGFPRYAAVRVTHVGTNLLILDWAFQTDPGNPELRVTQR